MSLLTVQKLSVTFAGKDIFRDLGFNVETGDRIGLIGPNGSGKTSLMRLIMGEISSDSGEIRVAGKSRVGYLAQDIQETLSGTILRYVLEAAPNRVYLENELVRVEEALKNESDSVKQAGLAKKLAEIHHETDHVEQEYPRHEAEKILEGLGFRTAELDSQISVLSGGWKTRAALAALLYQRPDLLLLDEPTNHLDIPTVHWLEGYLANYAGAMILISHDKDFLNRQVNRIISLEPEGVRFYTGNYDYYLKAREEEKRNLEATARKQDQKVKEAQKFIERFRAKATKARQAQSKLKLLEKMDLVKTHRKAKTARFSFPEVKKSGRDVLTIRSLKKSFGTNTLYDNLDLILSRGERIAIIGPNGSGKTTLLKMIAGELAPDKGTITKGHEVIMSYFAQHHSEMLNPRNTVLEEVYKVAPNESISFVRGVCGAFLFSGNDVDKLTGILSGGERARVALARLLVSPGNFMVMDEPTNHLDIASSEALIEAFESYNGTLLFVSHNQSFVNSLATKIWDLRNGEIIEYPGNLTEYYRHLEDEEKRSKGIKTENISDVVEKVDKDRKDRKVQKREEAEKRKLIHHVLKPLKAELEKIESNISELETRQKNIEQKLADPDFFNDSGKSVPVLNEYNEIRDKLERLMHKWEKINEELESKKEGAGM